ncbi:MAG: ATP-binding protein [Thermoleophilia bacterium]
MNFNKSLKGRLAAYFALSIVISLLISGFISVGLVQRYLRQKTIADLKSQSEALAKQIEKEGLPQNRYINDLEKMYQTRAMFVPYREQALGRLPQAGPRGDAVEPSMPLSQLDWELLKSGDTQVTEADLPEGDRQVVLVAHGIRAGDEMAGAVVLTKPIRLLQSWSPLAAEFLIAAITSLAVSLLLSFLLARRLSRPLHEITMAATAVAAGDFSTELEVRSEDEIGKLADAFRHMSDEVQQAQQQQREFVINVSHELKTPLTAINGHVQALRDGIATDPQAIGKSLEVINSETKRLSRLIEDLLSLAKFDAHQFELKRATVSAREAVESVKDGLARDAEERGISLQSGENAAEIMLSTDPDRLRQVLSNLVQNALTHTPAGGNVSISTRKEANSVIFEVSDTGQGIQSEDLPHIFDRFYRAGSGARSAGLGLGLAISRDLARAMDGDITVTSRTGDGSVFTVKLPA